MATHSEILANAKFLLRSVGHGSGNALSLVEEYLGELQESVAEGLSLTDYVRQELESAGHQVPSGLTDALNEIGKLLHNEMLSSGSGLVPSLDAGSAVDDDAEDMAEFIDEFEVDDVDTLSRTVVHDYGLATEQ